MGEAATAQARLPTADSLTDGFTNSWSQSDPLLVFQKRTSVIRMSFQLPKSLQCFDAVGWAAVRAPGL